MAHWSDGSGRINLVISRDDASSGSHQGDCEDDVRALRRFPHIAEQVARWNPAHVRAALKEVGAWDAAELADEDMNEVRLLWIACGDVIDSDDEDESEDDA